MPDEPQSPGPRDQPADATPAATTPARPDDGARDLAGLEEVLGHRFARRQLLLDAVTHRSYVHEFPAPDVVSNERLEFLGDAVLALTSADLLFALAPGSSEGELTALRAALVRASALAAVGRRIGLGRYLRLGRGEETTGGRERDLLLASALEAVVGALYLDGGLAAARRFVDPLLRDVAAEVGTARRLKDAKSLLQELAQARLGITPTYRVVEAAGPSHDPHFAVEVLLGARVAARGEGRNKRQAEQAAAARALEDPGWSPDGAAAPR